MIDENIERLNKIEEKYKTGKIDLEDLVNGCYNIGLDAAKKAVKESDYLPCVSDSSPQIHLIDADGDIIESLNTLAHARKLMYAINKDADSIAHHYQVSIRDDR